MECTHEEADNRIFFHANHAIKIENYGSVVIACPDTDIFVSAPHHFCKLKYFDLEELWFVSVRGNSRTFFPIQDLANDLDSDLVVLLPAIHALTRCDTASKVGTKSKAVREGAGCYNLLYAFGRDALSDEMIADAEKFLLRYVTKYNVNTFDELRFIVYHEKYLEFDNEHFPPTSDNIRQHILRAYLQCYIWLHFTFWEIMTWIHLNMAIYQLRTETLFQSYQLSRQFPATFLSHATAKNAAKPVSANVDYWKFVAVSSVNVTQVLGVRTL